ncbi:diguanylate cyclase (GGDEF)-like protein/PAS domain S-box-containing protein [Rhodoferax ferrireducens]|uniref:Diguanylate cyclase (GGDEF)-like protein/PAS domain S-box-containing protein n=1 Tax=Rhodoferax ferrireducens TaxID=192843 RepID=A0ABU2CEX3_9BURK|nr:EAL domain-containing protein [Rhodoferax ferrireducens]MDR7379902.1 diguanylate cyclase (GGDEF)-like protein/PAS domain S-box-containing protein [Rhodoferax ferrireducens]
MSVNLPVDTYRFLLEQVQAAIFVVQEHCLVYVNPNLKQLFGYLPEDDLYGMEAAELTAPDYRDYVRQQVQARVEGVPGHVYEIECIRKDGTQFSAQVRGVRIELPNGVADLVTLHDVSDIKRATRMAQSRAQLLNNAEELARIGSAEMDLATGAMTLSSGMFNIFGETPSEATVTREWLLSRVPAADRPYVQAISEGVSPGEILEFQHRITHTDGSLRTVLHRGLAEADAQGQVVRSVTILQDITEQRAAEQRLDTLANTDEITGLRNRNALSERLDTALREAQRKEVQIAVIGIQIGQLKLVSESLGKAGGNLLLAAVAGRLQENLDASDMLAHFGNGEFTVLLARDEPMDEPLARQLAVAWMDALGVPLMVGDNEIKVTCGMGIALFPQHGQEPEELLHHVQAATYHADALGSNQICVFSVDMQSKAVTRLALESGLRRALERNEFELYYQPKLDLVSGAVVGAEALLQWHASGQPLGARTAFLDVAEETGLIVPIGEWVLRSLCEQSLAWQRQGLAPGRLAMNLSARQLLQSDIVQRIQTILAETGLESRYLGLEITEGVLLGERAHVTRVLGELKAMGIEISLEDFGTGYSNLSYLRTLPIDVVKVDRSFVHDVTAASQDVSITRAIITMAHSLQMKVLAEGVETEGQLALLIANHCDQMQGHYFSTSIPADAMAEVLRQGRQLPEHLLLRRTHQRTLLLVDDEDNIVASLKRLLRRDGYNVVTANSGAQGLQRLAEHAVDVIVSDQRMPGMTGVEFLRRAKELYPETVRMVLSGYTELQSITDAINEGAIYKFLTKPWDDERLRGHIAEAFSHKEMADENSRLGRAVIVANQELSAVNERLQTLLAEQREQINRESNSLVVAREVLDLIPTAIIGLDLAGMVAFVNADAEALFGSAALLLGRDADEVLSPELLQVWRQADGAYHDLQFAAQAYRVVCRVIGEESHSRGKLLVLTPAGPGLSLV